MRFRTQAVAYPYFVVALLLYGLQVAFGLLSAAKYLGPDPLQAWLPFDVSKAHNLLVVWVLTGFMGAAYWLVPEESRTELHSPRMAYWALALWALGGVTAVASSTFGCLEPLGLSMTTWDAAINPSIEVQNLSDEIPLSASCVAIDECHGAVTGPKAALGAVKGAEGEFRLSRCRSSGYRSFSSARRRGSARSLTVNRIDLSCVSRLAFNPQPSESM